MAPDAFLGKILHLIDEHGWAVVGVGGAGCDCAGCDGGADDGIQFSYTVGLSTLGFPEVITYGLPQSVGQACLNRIGQQVSAGAVVVVLEAMKMEHTIRADIDGVVAELHVTLGQSVDAHTVVATLTPEADVGAPSHGTGGVES